jgi:predicted SnoaL-like aldol condensation-catalyzing enzyme
MTDTNKQLSSRFTELFTTGDRATAEEILSRDFVLHLADGDIDGREAFQEFLAGYRAQFPKARSVVEDQIAEGDKVVTRWDAHVGLGFVLKGVTIERVARGRIVEVWVSKDDLGLRDHMSAA